MTESSVHAAGFLLWHAVAAGADDTPATRPLLTSTAPEHCSSPLSLPITPAKAITHDGLSLCHFTYAITKAVAEAGRILLATSGPYIALHSITYSSLDIALAIGNLSGPVHIEHTMGLTEPCQ